MIETVDWLGLLVMSEHLFDESRVDRGLYCQNVLHYVDRLLFAPL